MPIYEVLTRRVTRETIVVDAPTADDAERAAVEALMDYDDVEVDRPQPLPGGKTNVYFCTACGYATHKTAWGPGWNQCPVCEETGTAPAVSS